MTEYDPSKCVVFNKTKEAWGGLSNMCSGFPIILPNNIRAESSEALYQALRFPDNPELQREIISTKNAFRAKLIAKANKNQTTPGWEDVLVPLRLRAMNYAIRAKAHSCPAFVELLMQTWPRDIVEKSHNDMYWGAVQDGNVLVGDNTLGRSLMVVRNTIKHWGCFGNEQDPPRGLFLLGMSLPIINGRYTADAG